MPTRIEKEPDSLFPSVVLYRSDIEHIYDVIAKETKKEVIIGDGEYTYASLQELVDRRGKTTRYLSFGTHDKGMSDWSLPRVRFSVSNQSFRNRLDISPALSNEGRAIYHAISTLLNERKRFGRIASFHEMFGWKTMIAQCLLGSAWGLAFPHSLFHGHYILATILAMIASLWLCGLFLFFFSLADSSGVFSRIHLVNRHEKPEGIIQRNWEKITVGILLLFAGIFIKSGWDWAWGTASPPTDKQQEQGSSGPPALAKPSPTPAAGTSAPAKPSTTGTSPPP